MKRYYYIDEKGVKHNYAGNVINDYITNETYGLITLQEKVDKDVMLEWHDPIEAQEGWSSYFAYTTNDGKMKVYDGLKSNIKKNFSDGSYFFTMVTTDVIDLTYHEAIAPVKEYFTYIDENGVEQVYNGKAFYDKFTSTYYFYK